MRFQRLDLLRYGKFTDRAIALPRPANGCDFHAIVGPNEAGKSTLRAAILDLLYGIPRLTPHAFIHVMSDMRLGAAVEHQGETLEFQRSKGNKQTLRSPADEPLPDQALAPFLGTTDRAFFDQMFGLDHEKLIAGGHHILTAASDVGQILFQSAAGIAGLGTVREALEKEADGLWSKHKSKERAYYVAAAEFDQATAALKQHTVRSKQWSEADAQLKEVDAAVAAARQRYAELQARKDRLERIRRVAPFLAALREHRQALETLGDTADLPPDAGQLLLAAEREIALAQVAVKAQGDQAAAAAAKRAAIQVDDAVLALRADIQALAEQRLQFRAHERDITLRQAEVDAQWQAARAAAAQLGWDAATAEALQAQLPSLPRRHALARLVRSHDGLWQALQAARQAHAAKRAEQDRARQQLATLPDTETPPGLQAALSAAQHLGDVALQRQRLEAEVDARSEAWERAQLALGRWRMAPEQLLALNLPSPAVVEAFDHEQRSDIAETRAAGKRLQSLLAAMRSQELEIAQFQETHRTVSREQVLVARQMRDAHWQALKAEPAALANHAADFERQLAEADTLADRHHETIQAATELEAKRRELERTGLALAESEQEQVRLEAERQRRESRWTTLAAECGLAGMPLDTFVGWAEARKAALAADEALRNARRILQTHDTTVERAAAGLAAELGRQGIAVTAGIPLPALVLQAGTLVQSLDDARGQRRALQQQVDEGNLVLAGLQTRLDEAGRQMEAWQQAWRQALAEAGLAPADAAAEATGHLTPQVTAVEAALALFEQIDAALAQMQAIRRDRIDAMRADLAAFAAEAERLASLLAPALRGRPAAELAHHLASRLAEAQEAAAETERQARAEQEARQLADTATRQAEAAQAALLPLLQRAGVNSNAELAEAIRRTETGRQLQEAVAVAERSLHNGGDGLTIEQLAAEAAAVDPGQLVAEMAEEAAEMDRLLDEQRQLSAERQSAATALAQIAGSDAAAQAEAQRQQALAKMADAVERYLKVYTAARLLKWSVDKYREARQGPMLTRAGSIFAQLTLGSFERLVVDYDSDPPQLLGRRPDGAVVGVTGLSEGSRDQLYLALRLAALDLHLEQAHALPFIADDLFINYDDRRATAGLTALRDLSRKTQVLFLTHHDHLLPVISEVFGAEVNVVRL